MTAEHINYLRQPSDTILKAVGNMATDFVSPFNETTELTELTNQLPEPKTKEGATARKFAIAATLIKEKFQSLPNNLMADERDVRRDKIREDSVRTLFKTFGIVPNTEAANEPFSLLYRSAEASIDERKSELTDLYDSYQDQPPIVVIDRLAGDQSLTKIPREDFVYMRRVSLLLIEAYTA